MKEVKLIVKQAFPGKSLELTGFFAACEDPCEGERLV